MRFGLSSLWGASADKTDQANEAEYVEEIGADYFEDVVDAQMRQYKKLAELEDSDHDYLDRIAKVLDTLNAQKGLKATLRKFSFWNDERIEMYVDITAECINKKHKEVQMFIEDLNEKDKLLVSCSGVRAGFGQKGRIESSHFISNSFDLKKPQGRADFVVHIAHFMVGLKLYQTYNDRAKGYLYRRGKFLQEMRDVKTGCVPSQPFGLKR